MGYGVEREALSGHMWIGLSSAPNSMLWHKIWNETSTEENDSTNCRGKGMLETEGEELFLASVAGKEEMSRTPCMA